MAGEVRENWKEMRDHADESVLRIYDFVVLLVKMSRERAYGGRVVGSVSTVDLKLLERRDSDVVLLTRDI